MKDIWFSVERVESGEYRVNIYLKKVFQGSIYPDFKTYTEAEDEARYFARKYPSLCKVIPHWTYKSYLVNVIMDYDDDSYWYMYEVIDTTTGEEVRTPISPYESSAGDAVKLWIDLGLPERERVNYSYSELYDMRAVQDAFGIPPHN